MNRYREVISEVCKERGWDQVPIDTVWLLFTEEIGELASAIRQRHKCFSKRSRGRDHVQDEMGDVFSYLFQLAYLLNIDLDKMWERNLEKMRNKMYVDDSKYDVRVDAY